MNRLLMALALTGVVAQLSCKKEEAPTAAAATGQKATAAKDPFVSGEVRISEGAPPPRFSAPLPTTLAGFERPEDFPPLGQVQSALCAGAASAQGRVLESIRAAAEANGGKPLARPLEERLASLFGWCDAPALCDWLAGKLPHETPAVQRVLWRGATSCHAAPWPDLVMRSPPPGPVLIDWYFRAGFPSQGSPPVDLPVTPALQAEALRIAWGGNPREARTVGVALGRVEPAAAVKLVKLLQAQAAPALKPWFAVGLGRSSDATARSLFLSACRNLEREPLCNRGAGGDAAAGSSALAEQVRSYDFDAAAFVANNPGRRTEVLDALDKCAHHRPTHGWERSGCLRTLARIDRARALKSARRLQRDEAEPVAQLAALLVRFPEAGALHKALTQVGLLPSTAKASDAIEVDEALFAAKVAHRFDVETGQFPNEHDVLLVELAALSGPALADALFEEVAPSDYDERTPYLLRAYAGGKRYEVSAENLGDWYDLNAVLSLLNTVLQDRGSQVRYATLPTGDQTATVLAAPADALLKAQAQRLIQLEAAEAAMQDGKAFEQQVFERLR